MENTKNKNEFNLLLSINNEECNVRYTEETAKKTIPEFIEGIIYNWNHPTDEKNNPKEMKDEDKIKMEDKNGNTIVYFITKECNGDVIFLNEETPDGTILHISDFELKEGDHLKLQSWLLPG